MKDSLLRASLTPQWNVAHTLATGGLALTLLGMYLTTSNRAEDREREFQQAISGLRTDVEVVRAEQRAAKSSADELKNDLGARITDLQSEVRATNRLLTEMLRSQRTRADLTQQEWTVKAPQQ